MNDAENKADDENMANDGIPTLDHNNAVPGPGGQIGPYKLLRILGEGGYGIVYMAERQRPVKRRVALRVSGDTLLNSYQGAPYSIRHRNR